MSKRQRDLFQHKPELTWREQYYEVIRSTRWKKMRERLLASCKFCCYACGWEKKHWDKSRSLEMHHKTYENLGNEPDSDVEILCSVCHAAADVERAKKGRAKGDAALYNARFDGWATKVYGEDYGFAEDESMHERFREWCEGQE